MQKLYRKDVDNSKIRCLASFALRRVGMDDGGPGLARCRLGGQKGKTAQPFITHGTALLSRTAADCLLILLMAPVKLQKHYIGDKGGGVLMIKMSSLSTESLLPEGAITEN